MKSRKILGYCVLVFCVLVLAACIVLVSLQWAQRAAFNLYGYPYNINVEGGKTVGGVNTALLMVISAAGGIVVVLLLRLIVWSLRSIRRASRAAKQKQAQAAASQPTAR